MVLKLWAVPSWWGTEPLQEGCNQGGGCGVKQSWIIMIFTEKVNRRWLFADIYYTGIELGPFFNVND